MTNNDPTSTYWNQPPEALLAALQSSAAGLSTAAAARRLAEHGPNLIRAREKVTALRLLLDQFKSPLVLILLFAAALSILTGEWIDAVIVLAIVVAGAVLGFVQEYNASNAVERLRSRVTLKATALRDGQPQSILAEEVVPGDVVSLSAGSLIPADGLVLEADDFFVNQAVLTGETFPVEKSPGLVGATASLT